MVYSPIWVFIGSTFLTLQMSQATVVEGFLQIKTGLWSLWSKSWVTVVGGDILLFKQPTAPQPHTRLQLAKAQTLEISDRDTEQGSLAAF